MKPAETNDVLNRLYVLHNRSLPRYLHYARPYSLRGDEQAAETLNHIVADQDRMVDRIGAMIIDNDGEVTPGEFPMLFTGWHDLSYAFLNQKMIEYQRRAIKVIDECSGQLNLAPMAKALAEEARGMAEGHLENLLDLTNNQPHAESQTSSS